MMDGVRIYIWYLVGEYRRLSATVYTHLYAKIHTSDVQK